MAHITADRVRQLSTSTGTGPFTVSTTFTGFRTFASVLSPNDTFWYAIASFPGSDWEVGLGTYSAANTITRTTVLASSNSGAPVVFTAGDKEVFITAAASKFLQQDSTGSYGNFTAGTITAALTGAASSNVLKAGDTMTGPLTIQSIAPIINFFETDQTLPAGRRRLVQDGNTFSLRRNNIVTGDFSSEVYDFLISATGDFTSLGNINPTVTNTQTLGNSGAIWNKAYSQQFISSNSAAQSLTDGAIILNAGGGSILFDDSGHKRISWNDGAGNFNIRAGNYYNGTGVAYAKSSGEANGGAATISLTTDAVDGYMLFGVSAIGVPGATVTYTKNLTLSTGGLSFDGNFTPVTTNSYTLGASGLLWSNVYATTFTGALTGNASGSAATFTSTSQNSQFNSIGVGSAVDANSKLFIGGTLAGGVTRISARAQNTFQSDVTLAIGFSSAPITQATAYTLANLQHFRVEDVTLGSTSAVSNQFGMATASLVNASNNFAFYAADSAAVGSTRTSYGFYSNNNIATGGGATYGFYSNGTASNYFAGDVGIGMLPTCKLEILAPTLGTTLNSQVIISRLNFNNGNGSSIETSTVRDSAGSNWTTSGSRMQQKIDLTWMGYIQFNGTGNQQGISFGTGSSTVNALSVPEKMRIDSSGNVGIGTSTPGARLEVVGTQANFRAISTDAAPFYHPFIKARGTAGSLLTVNNNDSIGALQFFAYNGTNYQQAASIIGQVDDVPSATSMPGRIVFNTTPANSNTPAERMRIDNAGNVTPGVTNTQTLGAVGDVWSVVHANTVSAIFHESVQTISTNYTITTGSNAMTPGPITIASGFTVTVPSGSVWTIV